MAAPGRLRCRDSNSLMHIFTNGRKRVIALAEEIMRIEYPAGVARTSLAVAFVAMLASTPSYPHRHSLHHSHHQHPCSISSAARSNNRPSDGSSSLYSPRALRRVRTLIQLRLLELRKERLSLVARAIERNLPVDAFFSAAPEPTPPRRDPTKKCFSP